MSCAPGLNDERHHKPQSLFSYVAVTRSRIDGYILDHILISPFEYPWAFTEHTYRCTFIAVSRNSGNSQMI